MIQRFWLILPVFLIIVGSAVEAFANPDEFFAPYSLPIRHSLPSRLTSDAVLDIPETFTVKRFEFEGNTAFSDEELAKVTAEYTNKAITFTQLLQAEAAVTEKYTQAGYINSSAVIPAGQQISNGIVTIQIIEGELEEIQVTVTQRLDPNYIRSRLALATQEPLNQNRLLEALQVLQLDPLVENISAELSDGTRYDLSLLDVTVTEADTFDLELFIDNGRAPSVGSIRRGIKVYQGNLLGIGDTFAFNYTNTDGSNSFDLSYTLPINPRNGKLTVAGGLTQTTVVEPPFDRIDITGDSYYVQLGYRQPLLLTPTQEFALGFTASRQSSQTSVLGIDFPLSPGADEEGRTQISSLRFFQDWTTRNPGIDVFSLRSQFSLGLGIFDATVNEDDPDGRFFAWRGQGQYVRNLGSQTLLFLRSDIQLATDSLVPLEQFALGGLRSVRGYRQDVLLIDNGAFTSAEVQMPILEVPKVEGLLQIAPFIDFGFGWNNGDLPSPENNTLLGIGLGLQWTMGDKLSARVDLGYPLLDVDSRNETWQENGVYFFVNYNFF